MASSNRHWPSLFKSKPCNNQQWQQPHDINPACARSSSSSSPFSSGCEERSPEPKPRWNPKPEQIRILEAIFNSGMVNPPRDEIRRIRAQLQEYGQVGDANVFYWFQNRKSRSKHKQRSKTATAASSQRAVPPMSASSSSSTTSSDKASPKKPRGAVADTNNNSSSSNNNNNNHHSSNVVVDQFGINNSPTSVNQCCSYFHPNSDQFVGQEPVFFPLQQSGASVLGGGGGGGFSQSLGLGFGHDPIGNTGVSVPEHGVIGGGGGGFSNLLLGEMIGGGGGGGDQSKREEVEKLKFQQELSFLVTNPPNSTCTLPTSAPNVIPTPTSSGVISTNLGQILGDAGGMPGKSTVFVDNTAVEVGAGYFNVKEAFGDDAILVQPSGHPVLTNNWGVTLHPLQNGACYYLVRTAVAASPLLDKLDSTPDLLAPEFPYQI